MRMDWLSLRYGLQQLKKVAVLPIEGQVTPRIPYSVLFNAVRQLCHLLKTNRTLTKDQLAVASLTLQLAAQTQGQRERAKRDRRIRKRLLAVRGGLKRAPQSEAVTLLSNRHLLSRDRIDKISRRQDSPLIAFVNGDIHPSTLEGALKDLQRVHRLLLCESTQGQKLRTLLVEGFAQFGASELDEEIYQDVETSIDQGLSPKTAYEVVARQHELSFFHVRTLHQRKKRQITKDFNDLVSADQGRALAARVPVLGREHYISKPDILT